MPQMKPMNWIIILISFLLAMSLFLSMSYFNLKNNMIIIPPSLKKDNNKKSNKNFNTKW